MSADNYISEGEALSDWLDEYEDDDDEEGAFVPTSLTYKFRPSQVGRDIKSIAKELRYDHPHEPPYMIYQNALMEHGLPDRERVILAYCRWKDALEATVGSMITCPGCGKEHKKKTYQHVFCGRKTPNRSNCKDFCNNWMSSPAKKT